MKEELAARIAHEVNRAYCLRLGDTSQLPWDDAPEWQKQSALKGIRLHWEAASRGEELAPSMSHDSWLAEKREAGWKYGPAKDADKKEHPCFVPYDALPAEQQTKDYLFGAVARASITNNYHYGMCADELETLAESGAGPAMVSIETLGHHILCNGGRGPVTGCHWCNPRPGEGFWYSEPPVRVAQLVPANQTEPSATGHLFARATQPVPAKESFPERANKQNDHVRREHLSAGKEKEPVDILLAELDREPYKGLAGKPLAKAGETRFDEWAQETWPLATNLEGSRFTYEEMKRAFAAGGAASGGQQLTLQRAKDLARSYLYGVMGYLGVSHMTDEAVNSVASRIFDDFKAAPAPAPELKQDEVERASVVANSKAMSSGRYYQIFTEELNALLRSKAGQ